MSSIFKIARRGTLKNFEAANAVTASESGAANGVRTAIALDIAERAIIIAIYAHFFLGLLSVSAHSLQLGNLLLFLSEGVPIFYLVIRRFSTNISRNPFDWVVAIAGSSLSLLINQQVAGHSLAPVYVCNFIMLAGMCVQIAAKIVLGRSFGIVAANRGVESTGPYRFVRHPMYLGYTMTHIGFLLLRPSWQNAALYVFSFALQVSRILREENILSRDPAYSAFAARVRYRLVPGVF